MLFEVMNRHSAAHTHSTAILVSSQEQIIPRTQLLVTAKTKATASCEHDVNALLFRARNVVSLTDSPDRNRGFSAMHIQGRQGIVENSLI